MDAVKKYVIPAAITIVTVIAAMYIKEKLVDKWMNK